MKSAKNSRSVAQLPGSYHDTSPAARGAELTCVWRQIKLRIHAALQELARAVSDQEVPAQPARDALAAPGVDSTCLYCRKTGHAPDETGRGCDSLNDAENASWSPRAASDMPKEMGGARVACPSAGVDEESLELVMEGPEVPGKQNGAREVRAGAGAGVGGGDEDEESSGSDMSEELVQELLGKPVLSLHVSLVCALCVCLCVCVCVCVIWVQPRQSSVQDRQSLHPSSLVVAFERS